MKGAESDAHPLAYLLRRNRWSASDYLRLLDTVHRRLGHGAIPADRKRVTRWIRHGVVPETTAQKAMAVLHGVPQYEITARPWPQWLALACIRDRQLLDAPWTAQSTITLLDSVASTEGEQGMDRRGFLVVTGTWPVLAGLATAQPAAARSVGRRIAPSTPALFEQSLTILRLQDDRLGSGQVHASARAQLRLITNQLAETSYSEETGRRLWAVAAEAARICGWTAYDSDQHALAEEYYLSALRAAATSGDPIVTANTLGFWAMARYSKGDTSGALDYADAALRHAQRANSPRMTAMIHARAARAHAKARDLRASRRSEDAAFAALDHAGHPDDEPACVYWVSPAELHSWAASNAGDLGDPRRALTHYAAVADLHQEKTSEGDVYPRSRALRLSREADAHLSLRDIDTAVHVAEQAVQSMGGVTSARGTSVLADLRTKLRAHQQLPEVHDFLERTV